MPRSRDSSTPKPLLLDTLSRADRERLAGLLRKLSLGFDA